MLKNSFMAKKFIVTGSASGIGRETALVLMKDGAVVFGVDKNEEELKKLSDENTNFEGFSCNLTNWKNTEKVFNKIPVVDGLVNSAGIFERPSFLHFTEADFDKTMNINVKSVMHVSQIVTKKMLAAGRKGSIVNLASTAGIRGSKFSAIYGTSKGAIVQFTRCLAYELAEKGIRANAIAPGMTETPMTDDVRKKTGDEYWKHLTPQQRLGKPTDMAKTIKFLLSDDSDHINGVILPVDGGVIARI